MSSIVLGEILRVFVDTFLADGKYPVEYYENLRRPIQMQLSEQQKSFSDFLCNFWNLYQISNIFKKKKMVIAIVLPKLQTVII